MEQRLEEQRREFKARFKALEVELARLRDGHTTDKTEEVFQGSAGEGKTRSNYTMSSKSSTDKKK